MTRHKLFARFPISVRFGARELETLRRSLLVSEAYPRLNVPEAAVKGNFSEWCVPSGGYKLNPIDDYYGHVREILVLSQAGGVKGSDTLLGLLILQVISAVEHYLRRVLSET